MLDAACLLAQGFTCCRRVSNPVVTPQGVPLRVELGVKDLEKGSVLVARRDTGAKEVVPWADLPSRAPALLEEIQARRRALCAETVRGAGQPAHNIGLHWVREPKPNP